MASGARGLVASGVPTLLRHAGQPLTTAPSPRRERPFQPDWSCRLGKNPEQVLVLHTNLPVSVVLTCAQAAQVKTSIF